MKLKLFMIFTHFFPEAVLLISFLPLVHNFMTDPKQKKIHEAERKPPVDVVHAEAANTKCNCLCFAAVSCTSGQLIFFWVGVLGICLFIHQNKSFFYRMLKNSSYCDPKCAHWNQKPVLLWSCDGKKSHALIRKWKGALTVTSSWITRTMCFWIQEIPVSPCLVLNSLTKHCAQC